MESWGLWRACFMGAGLQDRHQGRQNQRAWKASLLGKVQILSVKIFNLPWGMSGLERGEQRLETVSKPEW